MNKLVLITAMALMSSCGTSAQFYENRVQADDVLCPIGYSAYYLPGVMARSPNARRDMVCIPDEAMRQTATAPKIAPSETASQTTVSNSRMRSGPQAEKPESTMAAQPLGDPPAGAIKVDVGFPPPGTKWVARFISAKGVTTTNVYTILEDGLRESKSIHRRSYGNTITLYDRETANHVATTVRGKETIFYSPHVGTFSWPLYVGKTWTARYVYHNRVRDTIIDPVLVEYRVEALETVAVPAGSWNAFKIQSKSAAGNSLSTIWYAPELKLIVKRVNETTAGHSSGVTKTLYEITEYPAKTNPF